MDNVRINVRINKWLEVLPTPDPDMQRRGKLLNILLLGVFVLTFFAVLGGLFAYMAKMTEVVGVILPSTIMLFTMVGIFLVNRFWSINVASILFLVTLIAVLALSAPPYETVWGRNMIIFSLPIIMASIILQPTSSFVAAAIVSFLSFIMAYVNGFSPNFIGSLAYFAIALVAWLSASTLENALGELRIINAELDAIVDKRTRELVLANTKLTEARDTAIEANKYKTELTARVSHELRTPLGAILGYSEMLRGEHCGPVNQDQKSKLSSIIEMTRNLSNLITDWLDQAKLESGKLHLNVDWFEVREILTYVQGITEVLVKEKPIALSFNVDKAIPTQLYGDGERIQQILINLVGNAVKYTERGKVATRVFLGDDNQWIMEVKDTGIGIPKQALPTIFDSFSQVDGSRTREHQGFGLGLSIVHHLIDLMGGEIEVESKVGVGSTFRAILPLNHSESTQ